LNFDTFYDRFSFRAFLGERFHNESLASFFASIQYLIHIYSPIITCIYIEKKCSNT